MVNPHDPNSAQWAAREKELAQQGQQTGTSVNQNEINKQSSQGGSAGGCFPKGTMVSTPFGKRRIETLNEGDSVIAWSEQECLLKYTSILKKIVHEGPHQLSIIGFEDGENLQATPMHTILTQTGWKKVSNLEIGDVVVCEGAGTRTFTKKVANLGVTNDGTVFNLVTETYHNFIADGVVAHNFTFMRGVRVFLWRLYGSIARRHAVANWSPNELSG